MNESTEDRTTAKYRVCFYVKSVQFLLHVHYKDKNLYFLKNCLYLFIFIVLTIIIIIKHCMNCVVSDSSCENYAYSFETRFIFK
jgi:hypothetical protein